MKVYVGQTRSKTLIERLRQLGIGEVTCRGELPPRRHPWFYDNGGFVDWKANRPWDEGSFIMDIDRISAMERKPDFLVLPDVVAGGAESLHRSMDWVKRLRGLCPLYLAVQDGMLFSIVRSVLRSIDGLFVGGTLPWKLETGHRWVRLGKSASLPVHVGRCGTARRVRWAKGIDADSLDSSLPLWAERNLSPFLRALRSPGQICLPFDGDG